jgi:hypothetical protein
MHTQNETTAQGTAFAIAYSDDIHSFGLEDLVVFTVLEHTPWHTEATYQVPAAMPACPPGGCTCAYLWVPKGCGQPNMYMQGFKCKVTGATSTTPVGKGKAPTYCADDTSKCVSGPKQMIVWNQKDGNNVDTTGMPFLTAPGYNARNGFKPGPQDDIFAGSPSAPASSASTTTSAAASSSSVAASSATSDLFTIQTQTDISVTATPTIPTKIVSDPDAPAGTPPTLPGDDKPDAPSSTTTSSEAPLETMPSSTDAPDSSVAATSTLPMSFTSTWTGRWGQPTKFTCYAEE